MNTQYAPKVSWAVASMAGIQPGWVVLDPMVVSTLSPARFWPVMCQLFEIANFATLGGNYYVPSRLFLTSPF